MPSRARITAAVYRWVICWTSRRKSWWCDPETAPFGSGNLLERYSEGATVRSIIEDFNSRGLTTKRGKPFNTNSFNALLKNRKYIGELQLSGCGHSRRRSCYRPGGFVLSRSAAHGEKNKRAPAHSKVKESEFLLTTKLFCGKCERMMVGGKRQEPHRSDALLL